jgi:hypothetical protein
MPSSRHADPVQLSGEASLEDQEMINTTINGTSGDPSGLGMTGNLMSFSGISFIQIKTTLKHLTKWNYPQQSY